MGIAGSNPESSALSRSELRAIFHNVGDAIYVLDETGSIVDVNQEAVELYGYSREELRAGSLEDTCSCEGDAERETTAKRVAQAADGEELTFERRVQTGDGETFWEEVTLTPADIDGKRRVLATARTIDERKERERKLERAQKRLRVLFDEAPDTIIVHDDEGNVLDPNQRLIEELGYSREELTAMNVTDYEVGIDLETARELWAEMDVGDTVEVEGRHERKDGATFPVEVWISKVAVDGEPRYLAMSRDATERKEYEEALERARKELLEVIDLVPDLIFVKNREGEYRLANETTADVYGLTPEEVEGRTESEIIPDPDEAEQFRQDDLEVIESGQRKFIPEEELTTADGETRIFQTTKIPYQLSGSGEDAVLAYGRDITDFKTYERTIERQRDNLEVLNKVVRHDIRNDLQLVLAYGETLRPYVDEDGEEYVEQVLEAARNAVEITETARDVTAIMLQEDADCHRVGLRSILEREVDDVRASNEQAVVTVDGELPAATVLADDMLESVFRNLLTNAIQHNDKEVPEVTVSATTADGRVRVRIADNGPGIRDDQKELIFEEGEKGLDSEGTGLGLYLVQTLVSRYDGDVWVADNEPEGSVFVVSLPIVDE